MGGFEVVDLLTFFEREAGLLRVDSLHPSWLVFSDGFRLAGVQQAIKRWLDIAACLTLLLVAWPVMALTALAIMVESGVGAPILYRQVRVGLNGRLFNVIKFRSMRTDAEKDGKAQWARANDDRITRVGLFIRKVRIDELPQLLNVLKGEMSLVGPRPERPEFVEKFAETIPYYAERHRVKPGITGWAQLCYQYGASYQDTIEKLQYDLYYVKNYSIFLDILIMLQTIEVVLWGKGL
jgi:sugar transferase (PEP-CTERM system associated)